MTELVGLADIRAAAARIAGHVIRTPTVYAPALSEATGANVYLKLENLQVTGSFKPRGALNAIAQLSPAERARGVVAVSAGNHAQGVAYAAGRLGARATILMPESAPQVKRARTLALGAEVVITGATFDDAAAALPDYLERTGGVLVHPFDDHKVIAGQGTVGLELCEDLPQADAVFVSIGGGGLISGVGAALKALRPATRVIGVQSEHYAAMAKATGHWQGPVNGGPTIAEGMAAKAVSALTTRHVRALCDDVAIVGEVAIERALLQMVRDARLVVEGAGAAPLAALLDRAADYRGSTVALVLCGGNIDPARLGHILAAE